MNLIDDLRAEARLAPESGIVAVVNYGRGRAGLIPLWAGEGDLPTPDFINARPRAAALAAGETFYTWQARHPGAARGAGPLSHAAFRHGSSRRRNSS